MLRTHASFHLSARSMCAESGNPPSATSAAAFTSSAMASFPHRACSSYRPATSPGTPAQTPRFLSTCFQWSLGWRPSGAVSRKSSAWTCLVFASHTSAKPPPPMPLETGWVTPLVSTAAIAASAALPPRSSTCMATRAAVALSVATAKRCGRGGGAGFGAGSGGGGAGGASRPAALFGPGGGAPAHPAGNAAASSRPAAAARSGGVERARSVTAG